jgi:hypothetical protein
MENNKDLVEVVDFAFNIVDALKAAKENDGKIDFKDFPFLFPLFDDAQAAVDGWDNIGNSWRNSTEEERTQVIDRFKQRFDLPNDQVEAKIEKAIVAGSLILDIALDLK